MDERSFIFGTKIAALDDTKEVKLRLPVGHLMKLHGLKIVTGKRIGDTVVAALDHFFREDERATDQQPSVPRVDDHSD